MRAKAALTNHDMTQDVAQAQTLEFVQIKRVQTPETRIIWTKTRGLDHREHHAGFGQDGPNIGEEPRALLPVHQAMVKGQAQRHDLA